MSALALWVLVASAPQLIVETPKVESSSWLDERRNLAFARRFEASLFRDARERGFEPVASADCGSMVACSSTAAVVRASIAFTREDCLVRVSVADEVVRRMKLEGCLSSELLHAAESLSRQVLEARVYVPKPTERLTAQAIAPVFIPSVPPLGAPSGLRAGALTRGLAAYEAQRFRTEWEGPSFSVLRAGRSIDDCELLSAAGRPVSRKLADRCSGNWFELAYGFVPVGLTVAAAGVIQTGAPEFETPLLLAGVGTALISLMVGLLLNEDGLELGEHAIDPGAVQELVAEQNAWLASELKLTEADLEVAGLQPRVYGLGGEP